jgi:hypothetical protein
LIETSSGESLVAPDEARTIAARHSRKTKFARELIESAKNVDVVINEKKGVSVAPHFTGQTALRYFVERHVFAIVLKQSRYLWRDKSSSHVLSVLPGSDSLDDSPLVSIATVKEVQDFSCAIQPELVGEFDGRVREGCFRVLVHSFKERFRGVLVGEIRSLGGSNYEFVLVRSLSLQIDEGF